MALPGLGLSVLTGSWFWAVAIYGAGGFFWYRSQLSRSRVSLLAEDPRKGELRIIRLALWPALLVTDLLSERSAKGTDPSGPAAQEGQ